MRSGGCVPWAPLARPLEANSAAAELCRCRFSLVLGLAAAVRDPSFELTDTSSILRSLTGGLLAPADIADILERHVGEGADLHRCMEALAALRRIRRYNTNFYVRAALRHLDDDLEPRACVRQVIGVLRKLSRVALR